MARAKRSGLNGQSAVGKVSYQVRVLIVLGVALLVAACGLTQPIPPYAEAGPPLTARVGEPVILDGSASADPGGGTIVRYGWRVVDAPPAAASQIGRELAPPHPDPVLRVTLATGEDGVGIWTLELEVTDDEGLRATDVVTVTITP